MKKKVENERGKRRGKKIEVTRRKKERLRGEIE